MIKKTPKETPKGVEKKTNITNLRRWWFELKQPTPEQKRAWWVRRKQGQEIMDKLLFMQWMKFYELVEKTQDTHLPVGDFILYRYMAKVCVDERFMIDWLNRHIWYAPKEDLLSIEESRSITETTVDLSSLTTLELSERIKYLLKQ